MKLVVTALSIGVFLLLMGVYFNAQEIKQLSVLFILPAILFGLVAKGVQWLKQQGEQKTEKKSERKIR